MENVDAEISMEFHGNWCSNVFHGIPWEMSCVLSALAYGLNGPPRPP